MKIKNEFGQDEIENVLEKKNWVSPEIDVHDIVEMTQSGDYSPEGTLDITFGYS